MRYREAFRAALERAQASVGEQTGLVFVAAPERAFLVSDLAREGPEPPPEIAGGAARLAQEFRNGTHAGWVGFQAFWGPFNRLLIGDDDFIQALPDSIRADVVEGVHALLRASVSVIRRNSSTNVEHELLLEWVEVGNEQVFLARRYPLRLRYPLD